MSASSRSIHRPVPWLQGRALLDEIARTDPAAGSLAFWHIGQSGFFVKWAGMTLLFDPYLKPSRARTWQPPVAPDEVTAVDLVFCSHPHSDHLDPFAVTGIAGAAPQTQFVVPEGAVEEVVGLGVSAERVVTAAVGQTVSLGAVRVHAVPAAHGDGGTPVVEYAWEPDPERGYRFIGFVVELNGVRVYHAGDTTVYPGMVERLQEQRIDVALLPINGRDWFREARGIIGNTDHREAADLGHAIAADVIMPMHYDMFAGNPGSPGWFVDYCSSQYPEQAIHVPARCKRWVYAR